MLLAVRLCAGSQTLGLGLGPTCAASSSTHIVGNQTCTAPDYILVTNGRQDDLVAAFKEVYAQFYPEGPASSESFSRIIAERHFDRIHKMLNDTKGRVVLGGETKREEKYIAPTVVADVTNEDSLMSVCVYIVAMSLDAIVASFFAFNTHALCTYSEIFGPVLPILPVSDVQAAVNFVNERDRPLMLYLFSNDSRNKQFGEPFPPDVSLVSILNKSIVCLKFEITR
jgi:acyl-CoA reductase-like NAD-dependent aldehyde dehydrogenase